MPSPRLRFRWLLGGAFALAVLLLLALALVGMEQARRLNRAGAGAERTVAALGSDVRDARAHLFAVAAELRFLQAASPDAAPSAYGNTVRTLRSERAALGESLARLERRTAGLPVERGAARLLADVSRRSPELAAAEGAALRDARAGVAALDSLAARTLAGERPSVGSVGYAVQHVAVPLARLQDANRHHADLVRQRLDELQRRAGARTRLLLGAGALLSALLGFLLVRAFERRCAALASSTRGLADGGLEGDWPALGDELDPVRGELVRIRTVLHGREQEARSLREELAALRAHADEAERASERKTRFIGNVSHEFRTPLSSIIGFSSLLAAEHGTLGEEKRAEYLGIVVRNARHLLHVVNDILNLSKVEAGTLEVTLAPLSAGEVAAAVVASLGPAAQDRGIRITLADEARHFAVADAGRLRQVLLNLLDNAIKYSPTGSPIDVRVASTPAEVRVEVRDRGPGIGPEDRSRLFKEFSRITHGERVAGAGLGLALAKRLAEAMGGRIGVDSAPGEGSVFWVSLRAGPAVEERRAPASRPAEAEPAARHGAVAVVDDDPDIRALTAVILSTAGYRVVTDDGEQGVVERLAPARPAVVFLDLNLRVRSGIDVLRELRRTPALAGATVIAFTAAATASDLESVRAAGFDGYLLKPVEPDELLARVDELIAARPPAVDPPASAAEPVAASPSPLPVSPPPSIPEPGPGAPAAPADRADAGETGDGDEGDDDYLAPLRRQFRAGLQGRLRAMEQGASTGDVETLVREAHKLKGAAAGYGFPALSGLAEAAEEALRAGGAVDHPAVGELMEALRRETGA